jgi:PAS domain S-box-containing protein
VSDTGVSSNAPRIGGGDDPAGGLGSEDLVRLADNLPVLCWIADAHGRIFWYNKRWHDYCGSSPEGLASWNWQSVHDPLKLAEVEDQWAASIRSGTAFEMVFPMRGRDGVFRPFLTRVEPTTDKSGNVIRWFGVNTDVSQLVETERELRASQERMELALDSGAILGTWVWHVANDLVTADERFGRCFGLDADACKTGVPLSDATKGIHPDDLPEVEKAIKKAVADGGSYAAEYRVGGDGAWRWVQANGRCDLNENGQPTRFPGVIVDIHDRKLMEEALAQAAEQEHRARALLQTVMEAMPALIYKKDKDGRLEFANNGVQELTGMAISDLQGLKNEEFLDQLQAQVISENDWKVLQTGMPLEIEELAGYRDGKPRVWLSRKAPFKEQDGSITGLIGTSIEITDRKVTEESRRLLLRELHHRVKNLFAMVSAMVRITARNAADKDAMAAALTTRIQALAAAHNLITPAVGEEYAGVETDLEELLKVVVSPHLEQDKSRLRLNGPRVSLHPQLATSLALIVHELTTNAAKYGALSVEQGRLSVSWVLESEKVRISWQEYGAPTTSPPSKLGFGSELIRILLAGCGGEPAQFRWSENGLSVDLSLSLG